MAMAYWMVYRKIVGNKKPMLINNMGSNIGGGGEIRTHGRSPYDGFQDRCLQPLGHSSATA